MRDLFLTVAECYENALDNGYDLNAMSNDEVVRDMQDCSILGNYEYDDVMMALKAYRASDRLFEYVKLYGMDHETL